MNLTLKDFAMFLIHGRGSYENQDDINKLVYATTMTKMRIAVVIVSVINAFLVITTYVRPERYGEYVQYDRLLYLVMILLMIITDLVIRYVRRDHDNRFRIMKWFNPVIAFLSIMWAIGICMLDIKRTGMMTPTLYRTVAMVIPLCVYMHPIVYVFISVVTDWSMMIMVSKLMDTSMYGDSVRSPGFGAGAMLLLAVRVVLGVAYMYLVFTARERIITLESQKKEISDLSKAQNNFFSSMSHEIRTPINTIIGLNEMILRENVSDEVAEDAASIRAASNMLLHLINDILDMSKISSGQMKLTPVSYHPGDMLSELVGMLWLRAKEKGLEFNVEVAPDIPAELYGDEVRIKQILINLLNNAIKYTQEGSVTLSIQCNGIREGVADIQYSVKDTGMGIKKENLPHLFTAFRRVDEEQNRYIEGTGLGLSIVKQLTELMGGVVTVNSVYTQGSTFVIEIPQTVVDFSTIGNIDMEEKHKSNHSHEYMCTFEAPDARVLIVDDNESNLLVVSKLLRDTLVKIDTAISGAKALELTLENKYDCILMDHLMPEMDGIECFHRIREQVGGASKSAKVIALTANAGSDMRKLYSDEGFDGYLIKPVEPSEMESELARLLPSNLVTLKQNNENILESSMSWMDARKRKRAIAITTESIADIPRSLLEKYGIDVIPHKVETQEGLFSDGTEIDSDGLLEYISGGKPVMTQAPSVKEHEEFFAAALQKANNVIHITVSSKVRKTGYGVAQEGAKAFDNVTVFDTGHLSSGQGLLAIEACKLAASGLSVSEIIKRLEYAKKYVHTSFIVDNLDYLARSGQVSNRLAAVCKAVMFHPVIDMKGGKLITDKIYFGSRAHSWSKYIASCLTMVSDIDTSILFITYVGLTRKDLDYICELVEKKVHFDKVYCQKAAPAIAVNSGPGTFGLLFARKM